MPFTIAVSIGIVAITENSREIIDVLSAADIACYAAKDAGRNRIQLYHESDVELARRYGEMQWVTRINKALDQDRLVLYQQPIYLTGDTSLPFGNEFLLRMLDEQNHIVLPGAFIPAAERYNLMPALDRWVIRSVFSYIAALTGSSPANETPLSFINLSGASLSDEAFFNFIQEQMRTYAISPEHICFEITETAAIANLNHAVTFIRNIKEQGCHFALDDFGTGLSSFSYLKTLPVDFLKIDGSFVQNILHDPMDYTIVDAINRIGSVTGIKTIAEQVESRAVQEKLQEIGVTYVQGYGIDKPHAVTLPQKDKTTFKA
jgi:EAL domain-containing protein (putative c-di-GMP-specific phosphodiesterase class I)